MMKSANPEFIVFCGCMFSSKTTRMMLALEKYKYQGKHFVVFKPSRDNRYSESEIVTHGGWKVAAISVENGADILKYLTSLDVEPNVIAVDEAFMIPNVSDALIWLYTTGFSVVVSSLDLSYAGKPFKEIEKILPWATRIEKCTAVCTVCGEDALYTHKKASSDLEIEIGGSELYEPRCWQHAIRVNEKLKG